jgi:DNA-directed RNA polymerase subunit RPC12/RpoP
VKRAAVKRRAKPAPCYLCEQPSQTLCDTCSRPICPGCISAESMEDESETRCTECGHAVTGP